MLPNHFASEVVVAGRPEAVFDFLDDHRRLAAHMTRPSWMMAGARMSLELDEHEGRALGSRISLRGSVLGLSLAVDEVVTEYDPPHAKRWQTVGAPRLLVVGHYAMGYSIAPERAASRLRVFIDYAAPERGVPRLLGRLFGKAYAAWCTRRMAHDAAAHFSPGLHPAA